MTALTIVLIVLAANVLVWIPIVIWLRRRSRRARADLAAALEGRAPHLVAPARFFGVRSAGLTQVRGTGYLAATSDELLYVQLAPSRTLRIRRSDLEAVDTPRSFLGKTAGRRLLQVRWRSGDGIDEAAWQLRDLDSWLGVLR
jgi:hypothetical protein